MPDIKTIADKADFIIATKDITKNILSIKFSWIRPATLSKREGLARRPIGNQRSLARSGKAKSTVP